MPCSQFGSRAGVITAVYGNGSEGRAPRRGRVVRGVGEEGEENDDEWSEPALIAVAASS